jgi:hypothetical protein
MCVVWFLHLRRRFVCAQRDKTFANDDDDDNNNNNKNKKRTHLSHVRDVKQRSLSLGPAPKMFLHDAAVGGIVSLVQDGQFVSGKGDHVPAQV